MAPLPGSQLPPGDFPSHTYGCNGRDLLRNLAATLGLVLLAGFAALALLKSGLAGTPALLGNPDSTILATKARLASGTSPARIVWVGDSSCLINVDVPTLRSAGIETVNLGTLSYLGIDAFGLLAQRFCRDRSGLKVVLVVHPECLRLAQTSVEHREILETALELRRPAWNLRRDSLAAMLGFEDFRTRWIDRSLPTPLSGSLGQRYGFTGNLQRELLETGGTLEETAHYDPRTTPGSADYRIAPRIQSECRRFRALLPREVSLRLILSPVPQSHALRRHETTVFEISKSLAGWLEADEAQGSQPWILPDADFGTPTHLRPEAARRYTRQLAEGLLSRPEPIQSGSTWKTPAPAAPAPAVLNQRL